MTWTKLSDDFTDDCWTLTDQAFRLHVEGLTWSNRKLLDLRLPKSDVSRFAKHPAAATELVAVGWWTEDGDDYVIRHHAAYQRTRDAVVKQQEANRANGRKGGRPSREQVRDLNPDTEPLTEPLTESPSGSETERDRTGQAWKEEQSTETNDNGWDDVEVIPPGSGRLCPECNEPLPPGKVRHPACLSASVRKGAA